MDMILYVCEYVDACILVPVNGRDRGSKMFAPLLMGSKMLGPMIGGDKYFTHLAEILGQPPPPPLSQYNSLTLNKDSITGAKHAHLSSTVQ